MVFAGIFLITWFLILSEHDTLTLWLFNFGTADGGPTFSQHRINVSCLLGGALPRDM